MSNICVVSPHVDDDIYGCLGYILRYKPDVFYCFSSDDQLKRFEYIQKMYSKRGIKCSFIDHPFEDGSGDIIGIRELSKQFDVLTTKYDTVLVNSISQHQDHIACNKAMDIAIRPRPSLKTTICLEYDYCYNALSLSSEGCLTYFFDKQQYNNIRAFANEFMKNLGLAKDDLFVTSTDNAFKLSEFMGSFRGKYYAERMRIKKFDVLDTEQRKSHEEIRSK